MSFTLPDLVVEGAIRKGFDFLRNNAGVTPGGFTEETDVTLISNRPANQVFPSNPIGSGTSLVSANLRIPDVISATVSDGLLTFFRTDGFEYNIANGVAFSSTRSGGVNTTITGPFTFNGTPVVLNGNILDIPITSALTSGNNAGTYGSGLVTSGDTVSWTIPGEKGINETFGGGGEVLNMLFDFEQATNSKDGGIPASVSGKYSAEAFRLREFFRNNEIAIVQSFSDVQTNLPCISIQLANDGEDQGLALTDDFGGIESFDSNNGIGRDESTIHANTTINVGIHTKEQLLTKYIYHITKYFILSAKEDLIRQNFIIATFKGSDFTRDAAWQGDHVYTRFLNISGKTEDSWVNLDEIVVALENVGVQVFVSGNEDQETGNNFVSGSPVFSDVTTTNAILQLPNSVYFPATGMAVLIQRDGTGAQRFQSTAPFSYDNDTDTNILTAATINAPSGMTFQTITTGDLIDQRYVEVQDNEGITSPVSSISTFSTPPTTGLATSTDTQQINDTDVGTDQAEIHRSNIGNIPVI